MAKGNRAIAESDGGSSNQKGYWGRIVSALKRLKPGNSDDISNQGRESGSSNEEDSDHEKKDDLKERIRKWEYWETVLATVVHLITIITFLAGLVLVFTGGIGWEVILAVNVGWGCLSEVFFP